MSASSAPIKYQTIWIIKLLKKELQLETYGTTIKDTFLPEAVRYGQGEPNCIVAALFQIF